MTVHADAPPGVGSLLRIKVELWLAALLMAVAFGAGFLVQTLGSAGTGAAPVGQTMAPALTDEQMQGGLPPGHPTIEGTQETDPAVAPSTSIP